MQYSQEFIRCKCHGVLASNRSQKFKHADGYICTVIYLNSGSNLLIMVA